MTKCTCCGRIVPVTKDNPKTFVCGACVQKHAEIDAKNVTAKKKT